MRTRLICLTIVASFSFVTAAPAAPLEGHNRFALRLFERLAQKAPGRNLFISPHSIYTALAMTWVGARKKTASEMAQVLGITVEAKAFHAAMKKLLAELQAGKGVRLAIANALFVHKRFALTSSFAGTVKQNYHSETTRLDFGKPAEARQTINAWVARKTGGLIRDLVPDGVLKPLTRLVLGNAIFFKGAWLTKFDKARTFTGFFNKEDRSRVKTRYMTVKGEFRYAALPLAELLQMPYAGGRFSMLVVLPRRGTPLARVRTMVTGGQLQAWLGRLTKEKVDVTLPRFSSTSFLRLAGALSALGMPLAFTDAADFSGISGKNELFIDEVLHKAFIEVTEEGTKAGAATVVIMRTKSISQEPVFSADRPFLYLIRHDASGQILFLGQLTDPVAK